MKTKFNPLFVILSLFLLINSCKKDRNDDPTPNPNPTSISVPVIGRIVDIYGNPLSDVTVKAGNLTTTTDFNGTFYFNTANFNNKRFQLTFEKSGYFTLHRSGKPKPGKPINITVGLISENDITYATQKQFNSSQSDSVVLPDGSVIIFPANAFISSNGSSYNGTVKVKACYLDPTWDKYPIFTFGGDLYAKDTANNDVYLNPFKGLNVIIEDMNGNKLQLDSINNKRAIIKMKIPPQLVASAPNEVEMYVYSAGQGAKQGKNPAVKTGDSYQGEVRHFTYWSCEKANKQNAIVRGYVYKMVNGNEVKISGFPVKVGIQVVHTNSDGSYEVIVPAGIAGIEIVPYTSIGNFTAHIIQNALTDGETHDYDINITNIGLYTISGTVKTANNQPIPNALVQLSYYSGLNNFIQTITDAQGKYKLIASTGAYYYSITAKTATQSKTVYLQSLTSDTTIDIMMPAVPGNNLLKINGQVIFNITGNPDPINIDISGYFQQELLIYVHYSGHGMFSIWRQGTQGTNIQTGIDYNITNSGFTIQYGYQQLNNPDALVSGTIRFTKFQVGDLVEGYFSGTGSINNNQVEGRFSVPYSTLFLRKNR